MVLSVKQVSSIYVSLHFLKEPYEKQTQRD